MNVIQVFFINWFVMAVASGLSYWLGHKHGYKDGYKLGNNDGYWTRVREVLKQKEENVKN